MGTPLEGYTSTVFPLVASRSSTFAVYFDGIDGERVRKIMGESLSELLPNQRRCGGVTTYMSDDKQTSLSISDVFIQARSVKVEEAELTRQMRQAAHIVLSEQAIHQRGLLIRLISLVNFPDVPNVAESLAAVYFKALGSQTILGRAQVDAASMKLYFKDRDVPYELDIGPYLRDSARAYIELESRRAGVHTAESFDMAWEADLALLSSIQIDFVPSLLGRRR